MARVDDIASAVAAKLEEGRVERMEGRAFRRAIRGRQGEIAVRAECRYDNDGRSYFAETSGGGPVVFLVVHKRGLGDAITGIATGDVDFDRVWVVEGAPTNLAKAVLTPDLVRRIADQPRVAVTVEDGRVIVGDDGAAYEPEDVLAAIDLAAALRARLGELPRQAPDDARRAERDVAALRAEREKLFARATWPARILIAAFIAVLGAAVLAGIYFSFVG